MAQGAEWVPHLLTFQEQGLQRDDSRSWTPDQKVYKCCWHKGTPLYAQGCIHVHLVRHLSIPGRLSVYEVVGDEWQLNVINARVPFGDATEPYLQALAEAYRQMAMLAPTIVIGDMNAAPTARQTGLVPISSGHRPYPAHPTGPHRPTHSHAHSRRPLRFPAAPPHRGRPTAHGPWGHAP